MSDEQQQSAPEAQAEGAPIELAWQLIGEQRWQAALAAQDAGVAARAAREAQLDAANLRAMVAELQGLSEDATLRMERLQSEYEAERFCGHRARERALWLEGREERWEQWKARVAAVMTQEQRDFVGAPFTPAEDLVVAHANGSWEPAVNGRDAPERELESDADRVMGDLSDEILGPDGAGPGAPPIRAFVPPSHVE